MIWDSVGLESERLFVCKGLGSKIAWDSVKKYLYPPGNRNARTGVVGPGKVAETWSGPKISEKTMAESLSMGAIDLEFVGFLRV